jgi:hypothetical protein
MNMVSTVKRGFNPIKMENNHGQTDLLWGFSFNGIESIYDILMEIYTKETKKLDDAEELISGIIVSLYQNGILDDEKLKELNSVSKLKVSGLHWLRRIRRSLINKKLRLTVIPEDIFLILEELFLKLI